MSKGLHGRRHPRTVSERPQLIVRECKYLATSIQAARKIAIVSVLKT